MSSPKRSGIRTPFQDLSNNLDPKERKRQRERERYAQNRDDILNKKHVAYAAKKRPSGLDSGIHDVPAISHDPKELKRQLERERYSQNRDEILKKKRQDRYGRKGASGLVDDGQGVSNTPACASDEFQSSPTATQTAIRQSGITQLQYMPTVEGMAHLDKCTSSSQFQVPSPRLNNGISYNKENICPADDSDWLHRNDAYQMQRISRQMRPVIMPSAHDQSTGSLNASLNAGSLPQLSGVFNHGHSILMLGSPNEGETLAKRHIGSLPQLSGVVNTPDKIVDECVGHDHPLHDVGTTCKITASDHVNTGVNEEPDDVYGIFEPVNHPPDINDCPDDLQCEGVVDEEDDEEARIYTERDVEFESYRVGQHNDEVRTTDDVVYRCLPKKHHVLRKVRDCIYCGALRFQYEGPAFCCRKGKVDIFIPEVPAELRRLFTNQDDDDAKYFRKNIRYFNSHFSFTSLGVSLDQRYSTAAGTGIYTFRAHGQLYHRLDHLVHGERGPRHLQLYIYDTDESLLHRVQRSPNLNIDLIRKILGILKDNPYVQTFKNLGSSGNLDEYRIELNTNITLDQRRYNAPTASQVAAIWVEGSDTQNCFDRHVVVYGSGDCPMYIRAYYGCYDPLAYPLFFPGGETGWNRWLPYISTVLDGAQYPNMRSAPQEDIINEANTAVNSGRGEDLSTVLPMGDYLTEIDDDPMQFTFDNSERVEEEVADLPADADEDNQDEEDGPVQSRKFVSAREYYCFKLMIMKKLFNIILFGGRLFQQWAVDMYIKIETMRLDWYSKPENQKIIRADLYQGLVDTIAAGESCGDRIGKRIVLPRSFPGGDRDMHHQMMSRFPSSLRENSSPSA